jgi:hypothetical protein
VVLFSTTHVKASKHAMRHTAETSDLETKYQNLLVLLPIKLCAPTGTNSPFVQIARISNSVDIDQWLVLSYRSIRCNDKAGSLSCPVPGGVGLIDLTRQQVPSLVLFQAALA